MTRNSNSEALGFQSQSLNPLAALDVLINIEARKIA
jgi:hypothetical protein